MAVWIPNSDADPNAPVPYVPAMPRTVDPAKEGPADNPYTGVEYLHYCTRLLRWNNITLDPFPSGGAPDHIHKTNRFGDLGGYYMRHNGDGTGPNPEVVVMDGSGFDTTSVFIRYRFPSTVVALHELGSRGQPCPVGEFPFAGKTCAWLPGASDPSFFWTPSSSEWSDIETGLNLTLGAYTPASSLAALAALDQTWNLAVVAWMWAGYQQKDTSESLPYLGARTRSVDQCDVYYFAFLY